MRIRNNISLKPFNSFGLDITAETLIDIERVDDLEYLDFDTKMHVLGGGSNILMKNQKLSTVLHLDMKGIEIIRESESYALVRAFAGESWHELVMWAIQYDLGGIENLSLIPGKCGAAPMQNIGAYGVELSDVLHSVYVFDKENKVQLVFHASECGLSYRNSHFKNKWKNRYIITSIVLQLSKPGYHKIETSYGAIRSELESAGISSPGIRDVSDAVIRIRSSKLPDPKVIGNAGSFFKNPVVDLEVFETLKSRFPDIVGYPQDDKMKLAAGWLIDRAGWKGHQEHSGAGTHKNQALVIVNHGTASGEDIYKFSEMLRESVQEKFGVVLEREVNIWS